jgi:iron(III) transport system substrate-binding protein
MTSKKMETNLNKMPLKFIDSKIVLDESEKWDKLFIEIFTKRAK